MPDKSFEEKTEKATPKKRQDVRKKGEVAKSKELPSVAVLLSAMVTLAIAGSFMYAQMQALMNGTFTSITLKDLNLPEVLIFGQNIINQFII